MMKISSKFLSKYLKGMAVIAGISGVIDILLYPLFGFMVPSTVLGLTWFASSVLFFAVAKLLEEVKT